MTEDWRSPEALAQAYGTMVYRLAYARTGHRADAEDVVQEVFVRLLKTGPEFRDQEHARAWLLRVAANCANDLFRLPWRRQEEPLPQGLAAPPEPEEGGVLEAVLSLPAKYRIPLHLYYFEDLSVAEIGAALGKSQAAVKSLLFRARGMLRRRLEEEAYVQKRI